MEFFGIGLGSAAIGFVLGHFFGDAVWQFIKHGSINAYQSVKHKIVD